MTEIDEKYEGRRVVLRYTDDPYTKLSPGDTGTYRFQKMEVRADIKISIHILNPPSVL